MTCQELPRARDYIQHANATVEERFAELVDEWEAEVMRQAALREEARRQRWIASVWLFHRQSSVGGTLPGHNDFPVTTLHQTLITQLSDNQLWVPTH